MQNNYPRVFADKLSLQPGSLVFIPLNRVVVSSDQLHPVTGFLFRSMARIMAFVSYDNPLNC
ncbi:hypothetical protein BGP75_23505 [Motiliproteus sp. MSK22-1]|nr:hypothetical protein BGP75_23505 [Motiliproteus sp. MSK22-1]